MDSAEASDQESILTLFKWWRGLGHALKTAEHLWEFSEVVSESKCESLGDETKCLGGGIALVCALNLARVICTFIRPFIQSLSFAILTLATIAYQVADELYDNATLGEHFEFQLSLRCFG